MDKVKNVPELRFEGFTDDWKQRKLGDYAEITTGGTPSTLNKNYWYPKEIPWMSSGEVNKSRLNNTENKISKFGFENSNAKWIPIHSVLIALAGQGKTRGMVAVNNIPLTTNQSIAGIITNQELHYEFLFQNLTNRYEELRLMSSGDGTRGGLNKQIIGNIEFLCPTLAEQKAIGDFFKQLDRTIDFHQREWEKYKNLKISYLEKMFPRENEVEPELRFKNFTDPWVQRKLGDMGETYSGLSGKTKEDFGKGSAKYITYMNVFSNALTSTEMLDLIEIDNKQIQVKKGDVLFTTSSEIPEEVGMSSVCNFDMPNLYLNSFCFGFRLTTEIDLNFLAYVLHSNGFRSKITLLAQGISRYNISKKGVMNIDIFIPALAEQQAIGEFFRQLDDTITTHQRELEKYKKLKEGYLQKMFV